MESNFNREVYRFIEACQDYNVRMLLVGGSAVNFYGYKRHSADIDFWIDNHPSNMNKLLKALNELGFSISDLPEKVKLGDQNISIRISPDLEIELITRFNPGKTFDDAYKESVGFETGQQKVLKWNIISYEDLIASKIKSGRPKDLLDVQELRRLEKRGK
mgnify:CR=1 FL=1